MLCRSSWKSSLGSMALLGCVVWAGTGSLEAQESIPIEVQTVDLRTNESLGTIVLRAEAAVEWSTQEEDRTLVVFLPRTVPGPKALDQSSRAGLISLVEVGFAVPNGVPTTRITVHTRGAFQHELEASGAGLTIRLRAPAPATAPVETKTPPANVPTTAGSVTDGDELEKALRENELLRQRMAELHSDRLELRESLEKARTELSSLTGNTNREQARLRELQGENRRLMQELDSQKAALGKSQEMSARANARVQELSSSLEAAEQSGVEKSQADIRRLTENNRRLAAELSSSKARLAAGEKEAQQLRSNLNDLEGELSAARTSAESSLVEEKLAESEAREQTLARRLRESRAESTALRSWLSRAPEVLQADSFVVGPGDECLPLRPEPAPTASVLECLPAGSELEALSFRPQWLRVRVDGGREGWVSSARAERPGSAKSEASEAELVAVRSDLAGSKTRIEVLERELEAAKSDLGEARTELASEQRKLANVETKARAGQAKVSSEAQPCLTMRAGPDADERRLDCLVPGTELSIEDIRADWLAVRTAAGASGWVASRLVQSSAAGQAAVRIAALEETQRELEARAGDLSGRLERVSAEAEQSRLRLEELEPQLASARERSEALAKQAEESTAARAELVAERDQLQRVVRDGERRDQEAGVRLGEMSEQRETALRELEVLKAEREAERVETLSALKVAKVVVKADVDPCLSFRDQPSVGGTALDCLAPGTEAATVALAGGWFRIRLTDGREGWSSGEFLESEEQRAMRALEAQVTERDDQIVGLESRLVELQKGAGQREGLNQEIEAMRAEITRLSALADRAGEVPLLESSLARARGALEASETKTLALEAQLADFESLSPDLAAAETARSEAEAQLATAQSERGAAEAEKTRLAERLSELESELSTAREALATRESENAELTASVAELESARSSLAEAEAERTSSETERAAVEAEKTRLAERLSELESELSTAREALATRESENAELTASVSELESARSSLAEAEAERTSSETERAAVEAEKTRLTERVSVLEGDLSAAREALATRESENADLAASVAELESARSSLAGSAGEAQELRATLTNLEAELERTKQSLSESQASSRDFERDAAALAETREQLAVARGYNDELAERIAVLESTAEAETVRMTQVRAPLPAEPKSPLPSAPTANEDRVEVEETQAVTPELAIPTTVPADLEALARAWAQAWSDQRVDDYLSFYGSSFVPAGGMGREDWASLRRERLTRPKFVAVEVSNARVEIFGSESATVTFDQEYRSDTFQDRVVKTLQLVREGDFWKIQAEVAE